jgi:hypothetical protein
MEDGSGETPVLWTTGGEPPPAMVAWHGGGMHTPPCNCKRVSVILGMWCFIAFFATVTILVASSFRDIQNSISTAGHMIHSASSKVTTVVDAIDRLHATLVALDSINQTAFFRDLISGARATNQLLQAFEHKRSISIDFPFLGGDEGSDDGDKTESSSPIPDRNGRPKPRGTASVVPPPPPRPPSLQEEVLIGMSV